MKSCTYAFAGMRGILLSGTLHYLPSACKALPQLSWFSMGRSERLPLVHGSRWGQGTVAERGCCAPNWASKPCSRLEVS